MSAHRTIYHICRHEEWRDALADGLYRGSSQDAADGFIHFSSRDQAIESAARHRSGQTGLVLVAVDTALAGPALVWEPSRRGALFPHLHGPLALAAVRWVADLPLGPDGLHQFPPLDD
jgi:uncharacterized protein (DUF952 family)